MSKDILGNLEGIIDSFTDQEKADIASSSLLQGTVSAMDVLFKKQAKIRSIPPQPTLYGVDFKITPDGEVKLIEVNGANSGMRGFKKVYGDERVFKDVTARLRSIADDKKLVIGGSFANICKRQFSCEPAPRRAPLSLFNRIRSWQYSRKQSHITTQIKRSLSARGISTLEAIRQSDDNFKTVKTLYGEYRELDKTFLNDCLFIDGFESVNFHYKPHSSAISSIDAYVVNADGKHIADEISGDDIGLLWTRWGGYFGPMYPGFAVTNSMHHQIATYNKLYLPILLHDPAVQGILPQMMGLGLGLETKEAYEKFLDEVKGDIFVIKPAHGFRGYGVRFVDRMFLEEERQYMEMPINNWTTIEEAWLHLDCMDYLNNAIDVLSEFVPSKRIYSDETADYHDGCMRAIVFNGEFVDAYWRLGPKPMDSESNIADQVLANMSQGAIPQEATDEERQIAKNVSELVVDSFDRNIMAWSYTNAMRMEKDLWLDILCEKHNVKYPKEIMKAAYKQRQELEMFPLTHTTRQVIRRGLYGGGIGGTIGLAYELLQSLF